MRGLILALVLVLVVMSYAFWRAAAGSRGTDQVKEIDATGKPVASAAATTARPGPDASTAAAEAGGSTPTGGAGERAPAASALPPSPKQTGAAPVARNEQDEGQLMKRLRAIKDSDPAAAVTLARDGNQRFPDSGDAPERTSILIHALVATDKGSEARGEAEHMVNHYPDSSWVREIEQFTGAHRHRAVGVNDAGQLIFR